MDIILYILAGLFFLILVLFFLPVKATIKYTDKVYFRFTIAGIGYDSIKTSKKSKEVKENEKTKKMSITPNIKNFFAFINTIRDIIKFLPFRIKIKKLYLNLTVAGDDAALTAIEYGTACSVVHGFIAFLQNFVDMKKPDIFIKPGYNENKSQVKFESIISTFSGNIILAYLKTKLHLNYK